MIYPSKPRSRLKNAVPNLARPIQFPKSICEFHKDGDDTMAIALLNARVLWICC